jgi:hypothetical protein
MRTVRAAVSSAAMDERAEDLRILAKWYRAFAEVASGENERRWRADFAEYLEREAADAALAPAKDGAPA